MDLLGEEITDCFHDSFERCKTSQTFFTDFYKFFIASNSVVAEKFAYVDIKKQQHMLHASLYMVMLASQGNEAAEIYLKQVAAKHSRQQLDIAHHLYDLWLASLLASVTIHDPYWNDSIETAWRAVMTKGVSYMQTHYDT